MSQPPCSDQRLHTGPWRDLTAVAEESAEPAESLGQVSAHMPHPAHRCCESEAFHDAISTLTPGEGGAPVTMFLLQNVHPLLLIRPPHVSLGVNCPAPTPLQMPLLYGRFLVGCLQLLKGIFTNSVEKSIAAGRTSTAFGLKTHKARADER